MSSANLPRRGNNSSAEQNEVIKNERQLMFQLLQNQTLTATQISVALHAYRPNICRYKRTLEKSGRLREVKKIICPVTHFPAMTLTCNPELFPQNPQLELFDEGGTA